jgi:RNA polymerase sigma factor (sigma-70 family)
MSADQSSPGSLGAVLNFLEGHCLREADDRELLDRFVARADQAAFRALIQRHGPMVLGVCMRVLRCSHDAEDAFQATFLVLSQRAASIRKTEGLVSWLHGVARRASGKLLREQQRRKQREQTVSTTPPPPPDEGVSWAEVQTGLDEELERLPPAYREVLALCYLEGLTRDEAAQRLGVELGVVKGRLERGRKMLSERLSRRGLSLSAGLFAVALSPAAVSASVRAAVMLAPDPSASSRALSLSHEIMKGITMAKLKLHLLGASLLCMLILAGVGVSLAQRPKAADEKPAAAKKESPFVVQGRVTDESGKPLRGVEVGANCGMGSLFQTGTTTTGADGRYRLPFGPGIAVGGTRLGVGTQVATIKPRRKGWYEVHLARGGNLLMSESEKVDARGYVGVVTPGKPYELNFTMTRGATVEGRLVNEFGGAVPRQTVSLTGEVLPPSQGVLASAETDDNGRFRFDGVPVWRADPSLKLKWHFTLRLVGIRHELKSDAFLVAVADPRAVAESQLLTIGSSSSTNSDVRLYLTRKVVPSKK